MKDRQTSKVRFLDRVRYAGCYHCGETSAKSMFRVKYFGPKVIEVCGKCKDKYHSFRTKVIAYVNDAIGDDRPYYSDFVSQNHQLFDSLYRVSPNVDDNDGNILAQALFGTCDFDGYPSYFVVPSIDTFTSLNELIRVINKVKSVDCVFYAYAEDIDSSTSKGKAIIASLIAAGNIENDRNKRNLEKARTIKKLNDASDNSSEAVAIIKPPAKTPIKRGETPNEFWTALAHLRNGTISIKEAASMCNMCVSTFRNRCKQFNV